MLLSLLQLVSNMKYGIIMMFRIRVLTIILDMQPIHKETIMKVRMHIAMLSLLFHLARLIFMFNREIQEIQNLSQVIT